MDYEQRAQVCRAEIEARLPKPSGLLQVVRLIKQFAAACDQAERKWMYSTTCYCRDDEGHRARRTLSMFRVKTVALSDTSVADYSRNEASFVERDDD